MSTYTQLYNSHCKTIILATGEMMLNKCPEQHSCGTVHGLWTPEEMPKAIGIKTTIIAYTASNINCKHGWKKVDVIRCSWDTSHDFIYKYIGGNELECSHAFCGMNST